MNREEINKIADEAAKKAVNDSNFKEALVKDANEAIKNEYNKSLPIRLTFHEFNDKKLVFVLPEFNESGELGDEALNEVSGGVSANRPKFSVMGYAAYPIIHHKDLIEKFLKK